MAWSILNLDTKVRVSNCKKESCHMEKNIEKSFATYDILLCSFLLTQGIHILEIKKFTENKFLFLLEDPEKCAQLSLDYQNNALASARELFANREMLIGEIKEKTRLS